MCKMAMRGTGEGEKYEGEKKRNHFELLSDKLFEVKECFPLTFFFQTKKVFCEVLVYTYSP